MNLTNEGTPKTYSELVAEVAMLTRDLEAAHDEADDLRLKLADKHRAPGDHQAGTLLRELASKCGLAWTEQPPAIRLAHEAVSRYITDRDRAVVRLQNSVGYWQGEAERLGAMRDKAQALAEEIGREVAELRERQQAQMEPDDEDPQAAELAEAKAAAHQLAMALIDLDRLRILEASLATMLPRAIRLAQDWDEVQA